MYAFMNCDNLTSVKIPSSVTSIKSYMFNFCIGLTYIEIPYGITSIESGAFRSCSSLTTVIIPNSVTSIKYTAFEDCNNLTIYCEATSKPCGWDNSWNISNYSEIPVIWGYKKES
ncbi:MAG: leucine-rich repeat domain-containing protein [Candidatus Caccosoma sp.]|nr:leucine-rich repeat domain-containing protein [Candidatus Caccosoma sp.]